MQKDLTKTTWMKGCPSPYQLHDITHFPDWRGMIVWDAYLNNLASAMMIITTMFCFCGPHGMEAVLPVALTAALIVLVADLVMLVFDLADPLRFLHSMRIIHFTSALSVGVWALSFYGVFLGLSTVLSWLIAWISLDQAPFLLVIFRNVCITLAFIAAIAVICYKGVVFSCSSQPGVRKARWLTPFMVTNSLLMGLALYIIVTFYFLPPAYLTVFIAPMCVLLIMQCIALRILSNDVKARARQVYKKENIYLEIIMHVFGGLFPLILIFCGKLPLIAATLLVLIIGFVARDWLIGLTHPQ